ncbi:hypothetical protein ILUMI_13335 [Ignelater luminosus]|uniref:Peptidase M14 domain-containing protein n=1 Tax=Ignelater luminosus TaxID=2038154 RepID=A0A8K0CSG9_IGNLU|nr:hypothetical protein ILUMI_13335 [Ignelater luminosus]
MDFDETIPTRIVTRRNVCTLIALLAFWFAGAIYPFLFWPRSYAKIKHLEQARFPENEKFKFDRHLYSNEVYAYLENFTNFYKHKAKIFTLKPSTFEGRTIKVVRLRFPKEYNNKRKGRILVVAGVYAPVWDSVSAAIDLIHKLCEECKYKVPYLVDYEWYIIPVLNPDGYDYTLSIRDKDTDKARNPKNRVRYVTPNNPKHCYGVYIDRNFGFHWGESKKKDYNDYCWVGFAGLYPFSESESKAFRRFVVNLYKRRQPITMYIQLHGHIKVDGIWYPWRFTTQEPFNQPILDAMAKGATKQVNEITGAYFTHNQHSKQDMASGVISDWLMGIMQVLYCFIVEPSYLVTNSTDVADQHLYIEKARIIVFSLTKYLLTLT